jgi:hypothetical protein
MVCLNVAATAWFLFPRCLTSPHVTSLTEKRKQNVATNQLKWKSSGLTHAFFTTSLSSTLVFFFPPTIAVAPLSVWKNTFSGEKEIERERLIDD